MSTSTPNEVVGTRPQDVDWTSLLLDGAVAADRIAAGLRVALGPGVPLVEGFGPVGEAVARLAADLRSVGFGAALLHGACSASDELVLVASRRLLGETPWEVLVPRVTRACAPVRLRPAEPVS